MGKVVVALVLLFVSITVVASQPFFKVTCAGLPLFRGRADSIIAPGAVSNHVHRVAGGSNFGVESTTASNTTIWNHMRSSSCNTCSLKTIDNSAYWHPDLYYNWPNGSLSLVPQGGLTVYYQGRAGTGAQANPTFTAFPPGFRMIAGNPFRRSYNASNVAERAVRFACLSAAGGPETNGFPNATQNCINGLRAEVYFPTCWNGRDLDSPDHASHVAYPIENFDNGNCPPGFPVRLMGIFFEAFYSVNQFPQQSYQPFVLACADSTGYGFHGDFLNGWDQTILQAALNDVSCLANNTNNGNNVAACKPFTNYVVTPTNGGCALSNPIPLTEDLGQIYPITKLPGCQTITGAQSTPAVPCSATPQQSYAAPLAQRFLLYSKSANAYVTAPELNSLPIVATVTANPSLTSVFAPLPWSSGSLTGFSLIPEAGYGTVYCSASGTNYQIICNRPSASNSANSWEAFKIVPQTSPYVAILSYSNSQYLTVQSDGSLAPTSATIGDPQLFQQITPDGGHV